MTTEFTEDPFGELGGTQKIPGLEQRFPDRVLIMTTDHCFEHCRHCTRRWILGRVPCVETPEHIAQCVEWVRRHPKVRDVLLSGGDVLTLPNRQVKRLVDAFAALDQIEVVRICTRAPVSRPERITPELCRILARTKKVWANVHINTAEEVALAHDAAARLVDAGIPVSSQTVLLKGVNDSVPKMLRLLRSLTAARIRPYYVFMCDPVKGLEKYRVPIEKARRIERVCAEQIGGLSLPRFVSDLPGAKRKMPICAD